MSAAEQVWLYGAMSACAACIAIALYVLSGWVKIRRRRDREEMRRHLRNVA